MPTIRQAPAGAAETRSAAARKAAATRTLRRERKAAVAATKLQAGGRPTPGESCEICGRHLTDPRSVERGIGSGCWAKILSRTPGPVV